MRKLKLRVVAPTLTQYKRGSELDLLKASSFPFTRQVASQQIGGIERRVLRSETQVGPYEL